MQPDHDKLADLILYIARRSEGDESFSKTKLYKLLFWADFGAYAAIGRAITGAPYEKWRHGPVPPEAEAILPRLEKAGRLAIATRNHYGHEQLRPLALREPDLSRFTADEIDLVSQVIQQHWGASARDVSDLSHEFIGWRVARDREVIPYETALIDTSPAADEEIEYARTLVALGR